MFYKFMRGIAKLILKLPRRLKYEGVENIPEEGPVLLIANHQHFGDPVLMGLATNREVYFLGKEELLKGSRIRRWFFDHLNVIPLDREGVDRNAIKRAIKVLKDGGVLGVFPEGTRSKDGKLLPFKTGACFIASQAPCTIVPMGIRYDDPLFKYFGKPVKVKVGKSFPYEALEGEKRKETQGRMLKKQEEAVFSLLKDE
ncbi:MAG: lysophospholipid acyltransferase family protein [Bacillota bacterium]|nr:lysophospholipid acyltransferase family protein [Bacillota bacterium]